MQSPERETWLDSEISWLLEAVEAPDPATRTPGAPRRFRTARRLLQFRVAQPRLDFGAGGRAVRAIAGEHGVNLGLFVLAIALGVLIGWLIAALNSRL